MLVKTLVAIICVIGVARAEQDAAPVFVLGDDESCAIQPMPALKTLSSSEFSDCFTPKLNDHMFVVFMDDDFNSKDFRCKDPSTSQSCYKNLQMKQQGTYYPSVQSPITTLRSVTPEHEYNSVDSTGKLAKSIEYAAKKVVFVQLPIAEQENRVAAIQSNDAAMASVMNQLEGSNVVYFYTSTVSTAKPKILRRQRREVSPFSYFSQPNFTIYWTKLTYNDGNTNTFTELVVTGMTLTTNNANSFNVSLATAGQPITFMISLGVDGYFTLSNLVYQNLNFYTTLMTAPTTFSFFCGNMTLTTLTPAEGSTNVATLKWNSLQFQAPFSSKPPSDNTDFVFGDAWHCVGFFTPGILSGLFIVIILLAIMFTGVCWMVDINTMDRFDDPKGKTITINASE